MEKGKRKGGGEGGGGGNRDGGGEGKVKKVEKGTKETKAGVREFPPAMIPW